LHQGRKHFFCGFRPNAIREVVANCQALAAIQREAALNGSDAMSMEEINAGIRASRSERKKRKAA
jgi:hypothetical protein